MELLDYYPFNRHLDIEHYHWTIGPLVHRPSIHVAWRGYRECSVHINQIRYNRALRP